MVIRIGINGFGRIGRVTFRTCLENSNFQIGAINDPALDVDYICYLIKFDSTHGKLKDRVTCINKSSISLNGIPINVYRERQPSSIPWENADIKYVIESSGMFTSFEKASGHLHSECVKGVIVTAPSLDVPMIIVGVNEHVFNADTKIISCASSTVNCLTPIVKILEDNFGVKEGFVTSIHAMTPSLRPLDGLCVRGKHWRDHRSIHQNIIPAVTSACKALEKILPKVEDKFSGLAFRVPIVNVSVLDITIRLARNTTLKEIADSVDRMSKLTMKNIVKISKDKAVSSDFIGDSHSCTLDVDSSMQLKPDFFKLVCWYENEYSYACRVVDLIFHFEKVSERTSERSSTTKSYEDITRMRMHNEHLQRSSRASKTSISSTSCGSTHINTFPHHKNNSDELRTRALKRIDVSSILGGKNWKPREWLCMNKQKSYATDKPIVSHHRNPFTRCCAKDTLETIYKFKRRDETLADGEKGTMKIDNFEELTDCNSNDLKTSAIPFTQEVLNRNFDSTKTINIHCQENEKIVRKRNFKVESDATKLRRLVSGDCERSTCISDIKTVDGLGVESDPSEKLQKGDTQGFILGTDESKQRPKDVKNLKLNKFHKSEDFKTHAVKTINKVIDELSQTMVEHLFNFNKKSNKNNRTYVKNGPKYKKQIRTDNVLTEEQKIIINTNKNTNDIIHELQEKFANNKHQYLIYNNHKSRRERIKHDRSNKSCAKDTIRNELKIDSASVSNDNLINNTYVRSRSIDKELQESLKFQKKTNQTYHYFLQNKTTSSPKISIKIKQCSNKNLNRLSSTSLTNNDETNGSEVNKCEHSVASTDYHSNFESTKNDYTCFFENVDSRTTLDRFEPEKIRMEVIHVNHFHETMRKDHRSEPISRQSIESNTNKSAFGNFNFYTDKEDLYDKLDSTSGTDSDNSFQMNEKKSQVIQLSDLTNSLDDITRLDKICQIIEISDELSDKLFSSLREEQNRNGGKKWSFKDLCQKLKLDDFCNSVLQNISN